MRTWYCHRDGTNYGPFNDEALQVLARNGQIVPSDHVTHDEGRSWQRALEVQDLFPSSFSAAQLPGMKSAWTDGKNTQQNPAPTPVTTMQGAPMQAIPLQTLPSQQQQAHGSMGQQGQPMTGQPMTGQPMTEQPMTGQPMTGQPMTGQPMTGQPMTGQPGGYVNSPPAGAARPHLHRLHRHIDDAPVRRSFQTRVRESSQSAFIWGLGIGLLLLMIATMYGWSQRYDVVREPTATVASAPDATPLD